MHFRSLYVHTASNPDNSTNNFVNSEHSGQFIFEHSANTSKHSENTSEHFTNISWTFYNNISVQFWPFLRTFTKTQWIILITLCTCLNFLRTFYRKSRHLYDHFWRFYEHSRRFYQYFRTIDEHSPKIIRKYSARLWKFPALLWAEYYFICSKCKRACSRVVPIFEAVNLHLRIRELGILQAGKSDCSFKAGEGSGPEILETRFWDIGLGEWVGQVPNLPMWFFGHRSNIAHVGLDAKMGSKIWKFKV